MWKFYTRKLYRQHFEDKKVKRNEKRVKSFTSFDVVFFHLPVAGSCVLNTNENFQQKHISTDSGKICCFGKNKGNAVDGRFSREKERERNEKLFKTLQHWKHWKKALHWNFRLSSQSFRKIISKVDGIEKRTELQCFYRRLSLQIL